mgnify:CR=1 FL=1|tara:strand:+ start:469 stop:2754 length:2286 start_codon:yes stop_codon:yes gene_type:complete
MAIDKKANRVKHLFQMINGNKRREWHAANQEGHDFFLDNQLSRREQEALETQGMPTFTINRIIPIVEMLNFYATANRPRWQAVAVEGSDTDIAEVHSDVADYIWYISDGDTIFSQIVSDACSKSIGFFRVAIDANKDRGMGEVVIDNIEPFDVYVDPKSRDMLFKDAAYIMIYKVLPKNHLLNLFPEYKNKINNASSDYPQDISIRVKGDGRDFQYQDIYDTYNLLGEQELLLSYYEMYEKVKVAYRNVFYYMKPTEEQIEQIEIMVSSEMEGMISEMNVQLKESEMALKQQLDSGQIIQERYDIELQKIQIQMQSKIDQERKKRVADGMSKVSKTTNTVVTEKEYNILMKGELKDKVIQATKFFDDKIKLTVVVGDKFLYETFLPGNDYPIIPVHYRWTGTPFPMSAVGPLVGKQQELNKAHQLMVHNASLGSSLRYMYYEGSVDVDYWEKFASAPGALLPVNHGYEPPKEIFPAQLSNAFSGIVNEGKRDMEYLAGIYSSMQGDKTTQTDSYKGLLANDEYGTRRVKRWMKSMVEPSLKQLGLIVKDYAQNLYTAEKVFRLVQPNNINDVKEVTLNKIQYNDFGEEIGMFNDYAAAKFDIRVITGATLPINRYAYLNELKELMQLGVIDDIALLSETDIRNKDKIVERKSIMTQLQSSVQRLEQQLKDKEGTIETLERQLVQAGIKDKVRMAEHDMRKNLLDASSKVKTDARIARAEQGRMTKQMNDARINFEKDLRRNEKIQRNKLQNNELEKVTEES